MLLPIHCVRSSPVTLIRFESRKNGQIAIVSSLLGYGLSAGSYSVSKAAAKSYGEVLSTGCQKDLVHRTVELVHKIVVSVHKTVVE